MATLYYPIPLVEKVQTLIKKGCESKSAVVTAYTDIMKVLEDAGIVKTQVIHTKEVLCHPRNRGGLMLNAFKAHRTGFRIMCVGASRAELHGACVFEMSPFPAAAKAQQEANLRLISNSKGLLAPMTGRERFLTVGAGHVTAFCRAANHGCTTQVAKLADERSCINVNCILRDPEFAVMLNEGFAYKVLPWMVPCRRSQFTARSSSTKSAEG